MLAGMSSTLRDRPDSLAARAGVRPPDGTLPNRLESVAVVVPQNCAPFELGVLCEVFGTDRGDDGLPVYDFAVCSSRTEPIDSRCGFTLQVSHGLDRVATADLVAIPAYHGGQPDAALTGGLTPEELDAVRAAHARGAMVLSVCSGAFALAEAGLLDGRWCTTHWRHTEELSRTAPTALISPDVLYVVDQRVLTSAGTAAGIDLCLHLVREIQGSEVANGIARRMVVPPHRDGGQAQYVAQPLPISGDGSLAELLEWMTAHLDVELTVEQLAAHALLSPRTFARRFRDETGTTPHRWLVGQRVLRAQHLLESSDVAIEQVAQLSGFGSAANLRHHFALVRGTTPAAFRRTFRPTP
jgi:transcriptional regulator GlxA family with amidase domain